MLDRFGDDIFQRDIRKLLVHKVNIPFIRRDENMVWRDKLLDAAFRLLSGVDNGENLVPSPPAMMRA